MSTDYRALCAELLDWAERTSSHYYKQADVILRARAALAQPEPVAPTDEELMEIRDGAYCPNVDEVNDEEDSMWQYTSDYTSWLYDQGTIEEQQEYEAKGLRAVFNAGRRAHIP